jgi:class 3 adenylate cyclase
MRPAGLDLCKHYRKGIWYQVGRPAFMTGSRLERFVTELPSGTFTLLFSDIEGSTQLLERLGDQYVELLLGHQRLRRSTSTRFGGREIQSHLRCDFIRSGVASPALVDSDGG